MLERGRFAALVLLQAIWPFCYNSLMRKIHFTYSAVILVLVAAIIMLALQFKSDMPWAKKIHYGVYLTSGDIYFGELVRFPSLAIKDAYLLVRKGEGIEPASFRDAFWKPTGLVQLNYRNVIWIAPMDEDGWSLIQQAAAHTKSQ